MVALLFSVWAWEMQELDDTSKINDNNARIVSVSHMSN